MNYGIRFFISNTPKHLYHDLFSRVNKLFYLGSPQFLKYVDVFRVTSQFSHSAAWYAGFSPGVSTPYRRSAASVWIHYSVGEDEVGVYIMYRLFLGEGEVCMHIL